MLLLALTFILLPLYSSAFNCSPLPYSVYWNIAETNPAGVNLSKFLIFSANYTQTGGGCSNPNCKTWTQGLFPIISEGGSIVNGGVPQNANLSAHLDRLAGTVVEWIPDPNWDGNAVLDFEAWTTVWELNNASLGNWHSENYVNYSIYLEKLKHPDWDDLQVLVEARKEFDAAATNFFVETLNTVKKLRAKASRAGQKKITVCSMHRVVSFKDVSLVPRPCSRKSETQAVQLERFFCFSDCMAWE